MDKIIIKGACEHNLKNIDVEIPRDKMTVITGISGSGKSSLAFDTIYAEGQRRYVESLSAYARQFLELMEKPDVDQIEGLSPAISIDQKSTSRNPRSTVGTITEIYDFMRLLFARCGQPHCYKCGKEISKQTVTQITKQVLNYSEKSKIMILAPLIKDRKGEHRYVFDEIKKAGYVRVRVDGKIYDIAEDIVLDKNKKHTIDVVVDRLIIDEKSEIKDSHLAGKQEKSKLSEEKKYVKKSTPKKSRLVDSLETALDLGDGVIYIQKTDTGEEDIFSEHFSCERCGISLPELAPRSFSFNSPHGACLTCSGLGTKLEVDPDLIIPNPRLTLAEGAIRPWARTTARVTWYDRLLDAVAEKHNFSVDVPMGELSKEALDKILYGTGEESYELENRGVYGKVREYVTTFEGVIPNLERRYKETDSDYIRKEIEKYMIVKKCPKCKGKRLKPEFLAVKLDGKSIMDIAEMPISDTLKYFEELKLSQRQKTIGKQIFKEIQQRLGFLIDVGVQYLTLDRASGTLSGGEAQRIRLATQIGSHLVGVIYILDEPSIGLHYRDEKRLIDTLKKLRDLGNTVIVVEHDESTINSADWVIDIGPGAGENGGEVIATGTPEQISKNKKSLTGLYLSHKKEIPIPKRRKKSSGNFLEIKKASEFNLKNIDVKIPLGMFVGITGVSGSGKSTLVTEILAKALSRIFHRAKEEPGKHKEILGTENLDKVINIDQSPIGRTPRSNPATYTGAFTNIRELFMAVPEARMRGYQSGRFSFNVRGGRCEACRGEGMIKIEMQFLPNVYVKCDECKGKRYNQEALEIHYKGKNIADVLDMTCKEALDFFKNIPSIKQKMQTLFDVGLGYIRLGQPAPTLSGGEAQRIKLATELSRKATGKTLYILDEPTVGLHFEDVNRLLQVLDKLVEKGNTVLVIEHNMDVIKSVDWIVDLGPEGGDAGGEVMICGTPEQIIKDKKSYTGQYLKKILNRKNNR